MGTQKSTPKTSKERGSALIIALIFMTILTALAASLIFVTQIEVSAAGTYKQTVQARYVAESGAQSAVDWLKNSLPTPNTANLDLTQFPVTLKGKPCTSVDASGCVVLAAGLGVSGTNLTYKGGSSQYTDTSTPSSFASFFNSSSNGNNISAISGASYNLDAQLMNVRVLKVLGGGTGIVQSWKITSQGNMNGVRPAQAQVRLIVESFPSPIFSYGAFGNSKACNAISLAGSQCRNPRE